MAFEATQNEQRVQFPSLHLSPLATVRAPSHAAPVRPGSGRLVSILAALLPFANFIVADESMAPALLPGDGVIVWRKPFRGRVGEGDIVVLHDPTEPKRLLVKRVASLADGLATVLGDNTAVSRDSRSFGPVPVRLILGRVAYRYLPSHRRGPM